MRIKNKANGFTLVEMLLVVAVMGILLALGAGISSKFAQRRSVDDTTHRLTSELNLTKLQASRDGVQYRTTLNYDQSQKKITIEKRKGDSNRTSSFSTVLPQSITTQDYNIKKDYVMDKAQYIIDFNPNGTAVNPETIVFRPGEDASISKCGRIQITQFGLIRTAIGRWDFEEGECNIIYDRQQSLQEPSS